MEDTNDPSELTDLDAIPGRGGPPTAKERTGVQHAVVRLLDALAPERAAGRVSAPSDAIERFRTPRACILQAPAGAVTVSWYADAASDASFGELQVVAWRGTVSRPGSAQRVGGAVVVGELALHPVEGVAGQWIWRATDGTTYDTDALAAHCLALLQERMADAGATGTTL